VIGCRGPYLDFGSDEAFDAKRQVGDTYSGCIVNSSRDGWGTATKAGLVMSRAYATTLKMVAMSDLNRMDRRIAGRKPMLRIGKDLSCWNGESFIGFLFLITEPILKRMFSLFL
jgi:hypothetical protein